MAKGVVFGYPTFGHLRPTMRVVSELIVNGEEIVSYSTEGNRKLVEDAGAIFRLYSQPYEAFSPTPPSKGLFDDMARLIEVTEEMLSGLLSDLDVIKPDYLLLDTKSLWGNLVQQVSNIPAVTLSVVFAIDSQFVTVQDLVSGLFGGVSEERLRSNLQSLTEYFRISQRVDHKYKTRSPNIVDFLGNPQDLHIVYTSREFQLMGDRFPDRFKFVGPVLDPLSKKVDFPFERSELHPLIYISMGTVFNEDMGFYHACIEAFGDKPFQLVMAIGNSVDPEALEPLPGNFVVRNFVPQLSILERCDLFVTHGGMNSVNEGLIHQVPLVVIPQRGDQFLVAARVEELGAGILIRNDQVCAESLWAGVDRVLSNGEFRQCAARVGKTLDAAGGLGSAVQEILAFSNEGNSLLVG